MRRRAGRIDTPPVTEDAMGRSRGRPVTLGVLLLVIVLALAAPAAAEEWKIYLLGRTEPIVASFYAERTPWVFYRDDDSMYIFALGCNRVERVERGGTGVPPPACPVDQLPTTMPRVYLTLVDLEDKRLDEAITKLREQTTAFARAVTGGFVGAGGLGVGGVQLSVEEQELAQARVATATTFLQGQINDTMIEIQLIQQRVGALLDAGQSFPERPRPRYFFAPR